MDFRQLQYITTVAQYRNITKAADALFISQSALSHYIQKAEKELGIQMKVLDYNEHALTSGSGAQAASYIHLMDQVSGRVTYGVGISSNITRASIRGIFSAVNRLFFS